MYSELIWTPPQVTKREYAGKEIWKDWNWISEGDLFVNGAFFVASGDPQYTSKHQQFYDGIPPASSKDVVWITRFAGSLDCHPGTPC